MSNLQDSYLNLQGLVYRSFVSPCINVFCSTVCCLLLAMLAYPGFTYVLFSGGVWSVGLSSDGCTIVSVDDESGQNLVTFDTVSGWLISTLAIRSVWGKDVFLYFIDHNLLVVNSHS